VINGHRFVVVVVFGYLFVVFVACLFKAKSVTAPLWPVWRRAVLHNTTAPTDSVSAQNKVTPCMTRVIIIIIIRRRRRRRIMYGVHQTMLPSTLLANGAAAADQHGVTQVNTADFLLGFSSPFSTRAPGPLRARAEHQRAACWLRWPG